MNPLLMSLLGQEASAAPVDDSIIVEQSRDDLYRHESPQAVTQRDLGLSANEEASDHKGMFGVKGTLRDVLGLVGDAFLIQGGRSPIYAPKRRQERISDALAGFTNGGEDALSAIERVTALSPELGQKMHNEYLANQDRMQDNQRMSGTLDLNRDKFEADSLDTVIQLAQRQLGAALQTGDERVVQDAMLQIAQIAKSYNVPMEQIGLSVGLPTASLQAFADGGMNPYQQQRLPQMERSLDLREDAERGRNRRADQSEAGRNRRNSENNAARQRRAEFNQDRQDRRQTERLDRQGRDTNTGGQRQLRDNRRFRAPNQP